MVPSFVNPSKKKTAMTDPKEKDEKAQAQNAGEFSPQQTSAEDSNWEEHQRVDEEGNELDPDDIK